MATHSSKHTSSWLKKFIGVGAKGSESSDEATEEFEVVTLATVKEDSHKGRKKNREIEEDWEILTLRDRKGSSSEKNKSAAMDLNQTDGFFGQGANKMMRRNTGGSSSSLKGSPQAGKSSTGALKSALKQDRRETPEFERDLSPSPSSLKRTPSGRRRFLGTGVTDQAQGANRPASPSGSRVGEGGAATDKKGSRKKKDSTKTSSPLPPVSPALQDKEEGMITQNSAFAKVRDTLRIRKGKKKKQINKVAQYSIPELHMPQKYSDPFEAHPTFSDDEETAESMGHEFEYVSIPHNKPQYCDHCGQTAWGHHQVFKCSSE